MGVADRPARDAVRVRKSSDVSADSLTSLTLLTVEILAYCVRRHKLLKRPSKLDGRGECVPGRGRQSSSTLLEHHENSDYRQKRAGRDRAIALLPVPWRRGFNRAHGMRPLSEQSIRDVVRRVKPAVIINAGAYTAVDQAENERSLCFH